MKAYKGFDRNMRCRGFQFEERRAYETDKAELCETGFHACTNPLDVLRYYSPVDGCEYHEVELEDVSEGRSSKDSQVCGKRIRIGAKLGIEELVDASVRMYGEEAKGVKDAQGALTDNSAISTQIASSGDWACIGSSGREACIASSGDWARIASSGDWACIGSSGREACIASSGDWARIASSGDWACIGSSGYETCIASSGDDAQIASSGDQTRIAASGHKAYIAASGNKARISASGYETRIETLGANCVMMCTGQNNRAKGKVGSWIVLTEWVNGEPNVVARRIDGAAIKADTWYVLRDGQLQEVDTNE